MIIRAICLAALLLVHGLVVHGAARAAANSSPVHSPPARAPAHAPPTRAPAHAEPSPAAAGFSPKLIIYLAKGPANSCGPGCDHWIAVEGMVDRAAATRIGRFLRELKDKDRPIYFHSPGGSVEPAYVIGRILRSRKAVARVGRTLVTACAAGTQIDDACLKIKTAGGEVEAELSTYHSMCNSACSYLFLGATTREVAPDAALAVHSSKLTLVVRGHPPPELVAAYREKSMAKADRDRASFIQAMGISRELNDLIKTVKFESLHVLERPELYRFGIDTRTMAETDWALETAARPYIRKIALSRKTGGASFRTMEWRLFCDTKDRARLMFVREFDKDAAGTSSVVLMAGAEKPVTFGAVPVRIGTYEAWTGTIAAGAMKSMLSASRLQIGAGTLTPDGKTDQEILDIGTAGLEPAWSRLFESCPAAPAYDKPAMVSPSFTAPGLSVPGLTVPSLTVPSLAAQGTASPNLAQPRLGTPSVVTPSLGTPNLGTPAAGTQSLGTPGAGKAPVP
jgi:hypothetical protein